MISHGRLVKPSRPFLDDSHLYSYEDKGGKADVSNTFEPWLTEQHDKAGKAVGVHAIGGALGGPMSFAGSTLTGMYFQCGGCHIK